MANSHLQRTTKKLREQGSLYWKVEYYNPWAKKKIDLFNIIDLVVLDVGCTLGVQVTGADLASHRKKIAGEFQKYTRAWLEAGNQLCIHSWRKLKVKRGGKARRWNCKKTDVLLVKGEIYFEERC
jgi:hypothetical protein